MKAEAKSLRWLGEGKKLTIPFFQRNYVWNSISGPKYKTEIDIQNTTMIAINWGYDGDGMYSGGSTIWYDYSVTNWSIASTAYTNRDLITYGFSAM